MMNDDDLIRRAIAEGIRIATSVPIEQVPAAIEAAIAALDLTPAPAPTMRPETEMEHIARDMREGRFPDRSEPQMVPCDTPAPAPDVQCPCGSDVTDMDGHTVHDDDCPESWQYQATIRKSQMVAPAPDVAGLADALRRLQQAADVLEDPTAVALVRREDLLAVIAALAAMEGGKNG